MVEVEVEGTAAVTAVVTTGVFDAIVGVSHGYTDRHQGRGHP